MLTFIKLFIFLSGLFVLGMCIEATMFLYLPLLQHSKTVVQVLAPTLALVGGFALSVFLLITAFKLK